MSAKKYSLAQFERDQEKLPGGPACSDGDAPEEIRYSVESLTARGVWVWHDTYKADSAEDAVRICLEDWARKYAADPESIAPPVTASDFRVTEVVI